MKKLFLIVALLFPLLASAGWTDFYVQTTGNNLNGGNTTNDSPLFTTTGGNWTNSTGVFYKAALNPSGFSVGDWASVYPDAATTNVFVGRITATNATTITVSLLAKAGTAPADDVGTVGATSIRVGGAWRGPNTNGISVYDSGFPFGFALHTLTNASGHVPMVNFKNSSTYFVSNAMTHALAGPIAWQGYTTTPRDGGKAIFDGGTVSAAYVLFSLTAGGLNNIFTDLIFDRNGAAGNASGVSSANNLEAIWNRCVFRNMRQSGINSVGGALMIECEAYGNNTQGSASQGGFTTGTDTMVRCVAHDNLATTSSAGGFVAGSGAQLIGCIAYNNGNGFTSPSVTVFTALDCNSYSNAGPGLNFNGAAGGSFIIENCNFFKNGTFGINSSGSANRAGQIINCAFGSGTQTNSSGNIGTTITAGVQAGWTIDGTITYASGLTPWVDPTNGNFTSLSGAVGRAAGRSSFTQWATNGLTLSYPDIGAAQSASTNASGGSSGRSIIFLQ